MPGKIFALVCQLAEPGSIDVDGMLDDWKGVPHVRANGRDADHSFDVRCLFDGQRLALVVDVRDDQLVRLAQKKKAGDDLVEVALSAGGAPLTIAAAPGTEKIPPRRTVDGKKPARWLAVEDSQQPRGFSVELELPVARIPEWSSGTTSLSATVRFHDGDDWKTLDDTLEQGIDLQLGARPKVFDSFLRDTKLRSSDIVLDAKADLDRARAGKERVVAGKGILGLVGESYGYVQLQGDVLRRELVDLRGDGTRVVLVHLRQHGGGGSRDLVMFWGAAGGELEQLFAVEVRKEAGGNVLESTWSLAPKTKKTKKGKKGGGMELVVEAGPAVGWDEDTFEEVPAEDAEPIHLPWDEARRGGVYWLDGDTLRSRPLGKSRKASRR